VPRASRKRATWPRVFARFPLWPWGLEPTVRRRVRPIEPFTPTVRQRPCSPALSRSASTPVASPVPSRVRAFRLLRQLSGRDVLPAPPLGGAPRLPRPSSDLHREGKIGWTSETNWISVLSVGRPLSRTTNCAVSRPASREVGQLL